jgi:Metallo-peptidase family M12B Reprolysin-like
LDGRQKMGNLMLRFRPFARALFLSAAVFLVCGAALAQVNGFVVVNPIVVCDSMGGTCPPFGVQCGTATGVYTCTQSLSPSTATVNTPIGFVDGDTNTNLTRAILAGEAGIDVAFFPVQQYNSPNTNVDPWPKIPTAYNSTNYQHLHLKTVTCKDGMAVQASPDLAALTQHQICTEHKGVPAGVSNPPPSPSPAPPLASTLGESNALDVFFVTDFPGAAVFGISWINGDGVSIGGPATFLKSGPRFDNLAHEIGHALDLDHTTFGVGTATNNMMTTGSSRIVPSTSGCSITGVLYQLGDPSVYPSPVPASCPPAPANPPIADQLRSGSACTDLATCQTNMNQVGAVSLSPFINKTLASAANAGGGAPAPAGVAGAATTGCPPPGGFPFAVSAAPGTGEKDDSINSIIIALPDISGLTFSGSSPATQTPCGSGGVNIISQQRLNGNNGIGNPNCVKSINLAPPSVQCLQIFFSTGGTQGNAFVAGDVVTFNLALNKDLATIVQNNLLDGTQFTVITSTVNTSTAFSTTSSFGAFDPSTGFFQADSRFPDFATPNQINPNFVNAAVVQLGPDLSKCTPPYTGSGSHQQCPGGSLPKLDSCPPGVLCND